MNLKRFLFCLVVILFFILLIKPLQKNIFSLQFGDEEDNFVTGQWILQEKKLYKDIFFIHQPSLVLLSATLQKIARPKNILFLVKYHRVAVFLYSALWSLFLTFKFGYPALIFTLLYEFSKFALLGNLFLAETLVVYPIIFISSTIYKLLKDKSPAFSELILCCASLIFIQLTLLPLTPLTCLAFSLIIIKLKKNERVKFLKILLVLIIFTIFLLSPFISFTGYIKDTVLITLFEFIPQEASYPLSVAIKRIFFSPIVSFGLPNEGFFLILKILSGCYLLSSLILIKRKKWLIVFIFYIMTVTNNFRPLPLGLFQAGFHYLPFYSLLLWVTILQFKEIYTLDSTSFLGKNFVLGLSLTLFSFYFLFGYKEFSRKNNPAEEWHVNYSNFFTYGETIKILADKKDSCLTIPAGPLIYWQSNLFPNSSFFYVLGFMKESKNLRKELQNSFEENPPTFLYIDEGKNITEILPDFLKNYQQITKDNKPSLFFIHKDKLTKISDSQWQKVKTYGFEKP